MYRNTTAVKFINCASVVQYYLQEKPVTIIFQPWATLYAKYLVMEFDIVKNMT